LDIKQVELELQIKVLQAKPLDQELMIPLVVEEVLEKLEEQTYLAKVVMALPLAFQAHL
jgi:hypothetical protein